MTGGVGVEEIADNLSKRGKHPIFSGADLDHSNPQEDLFLLRFYLFIHQRHRERQRHRQREKQALPHREPNVELDSRTPGSRPEPKADAQPLSHPGALIFFLI